MRHGARDSCGSTSARRPGVGKTYAMLDEGAPPRRARHRRASSASSRPTAGRTPRSMLDGLEVVPRARARATAAPTFTEMDLDAVLARRPQVALVDELAHTNVPGSRNEKRWQDVEELLDAGIDVITTVNIQHLESLNDVVEKITGVPQRETVPDAVVRARRPDRAGRHDARGAAPPDGARQHLHGREGRRRPGQLLPGRQPHRAARAGPALAGRPGRRRAAAATAPQHDIDGTWEARERVVVALTGGPEGETLIRRAARIAARSAGGDLLAVHVARSDGLDRRQPGRPGRASGTLVESLGGTYHQVVGDDVPTALLDFARGVNATQLVLGASRRGRLAPLLTGPGIGADHDPRRPATSTSTWSPTTQIGQGPRPARGRAAASPAGAGCRASRSPSLLPAAADRSRWSPCRDAAQPGQRHAALPAASSVVVALVGGLLPALLAAVGGSLLLNYYFTPPLHTLHHRRDQQRARPAASSSLVAALVSSVVDLAARRTRQAARAAAEAETLATLAGSVLRGETGRCPRCSSGSARPSA